MTVGELIDQLNDYDTGQEVEICCYSSPEYNPDEMTIVNDGVYQIKKEISIVGLETDRKTVAIG